jgi:hypothetical protein
MKAFASHLATLVIALVALTAVATAAAPPVAFLHGNYFFTSADQDGSEFFESAIAMADFNGDGKLDLLTLDGSSNQISVALGNGDGTFQKPYSVGSVASGNIGYGLAVGDFNGDKILDFACLSNNGGATNNAEVQIFLGTGSGTFTVGNTYTLSLPNSTLLRQTPLTAGDVNGDGKLDLVAVSEYSALMYVFIGNGDGTFQNAVSYSLLATGQTSLNAYGVTLADFNGDGKIDAAVGSDNGLTVLLNTGSGKFGTAAYYAAGTGGSTYNGIATADFNKDGKIDVVVANALGAAIFLNSGTGTFTFKSYLNSGAGAFAVAAPDLNADKKPDVVVGDLNNFVWTWKGNGDGSFTAVAGYSVSYEAEVLAVLIGDLNGDGLLDFVTENAYNNQTLAALGNGDLTFRANPINAFSFNGNGSNMASADFNGDGYPDVVYSWTNGGSGGLTDKFALSLGSSHGALGAPTYITAGACSFNYVDFLAVGDVNGDGLPDVVAAIANSSETGCKSGDIAVVEGSGNGKFKTPAYYSTGSTAQAGTVYVVDVNGDGKLDIVTANSDGTISALINKGTGTYKAGVVNSNLVADCACYHNLVFGDFTGDGKIDVAAVTGSGQLYEVQVLPGNGDGTFGTAIKSVTTVDPSVIGVGDFDGDGKLDIVIASPYDYSCETSNGSVPSKGQFLAGTGSGAFNIGATFCMPMENARNVVVADLNADGKLDVVVPGIDSSNAGGLQYGIGVFQGNGDGTFTSAVGLFNSGPTNVDAVVADFNNDGMPDIAVLNNNNIGAGNSNFENFIVMLQNATQAVSVSPLNQSYGMVTAHTTKSATVVLTNDQSTSMSVTSFTITGTNASDFSETNNCGTSVKAGAYCTVTVKFTPAATGARTATLSIKDGVGTQTVALSGTGK